MRVLVFLVMWWSSFVAVAQPGTFFVPHDLTMKKSELPYRPQDGDKLGYSKGESIRRLDPEVRAFLDGVLRLYREPGVFTDRREAFAALGTEPGTIRQLQPSLPRISEKMPFEQYASTRGVFGRLGWSVAYTYMGRKDGKKWRLDMEIKIPSKPLCIDSRAVEGYLDLYLRSGLDGYSHPLPPSLWDRHGISGGPFGPRLFPTTPMLTIGFVGGCLIEFSLAGVFDYTEVNDDNILN